MGIYSWSYAITISAMDSPEGLAQSLVGPGITISNVTYTGANWAAGYFSDGSVIGIDSGIVLTTGSIWNIEGTSNTSDEKSTENMLPGDSDLDNLISGSGYSTYDATILEFDFVSAGDTAYFNYVFGSEEYNEYVFEYNDVFGFFFNGVNVAFVPGTTTPVSIDTVNNSVNSNYYHDNDPSDNLIPPYPFEYDGFTDVFTVVLENLTPGETYHLKLAIADVRDYALDSGVFIQGGSFSNTPPQPVPEPNTIVFAALGLGGIIFLRYRRKN